MSRPSLVLACLLALAPAAPAGDPPSKLRVPADFPTIQQAVDAAGPGATIVVSKGSYAEAVTLAGKTDLTLVGRGRPEIAPGAGLGALTLDACTDVVVRGFTLRDAAVGVRITGSTGVAVTSCRVEDTGGDGLLASASSALTLERNVVSAPGGRGLVLGDPAAVDDSSVRRNTITDAAGQGLLVGGARNQVRSNRIERAGAAGFGTSSAVASADNVFRGNRVEGAGDAGLLVHGSGNLFERERLRDAAGDGLRLGATASANALRRVRIDGAGGDGLRIEGSANFLRKLRVTAAAGDGCDIPGGGNLLESFTVSAPGGRGFVLDGGSNGVVDSVVEQAGSDGFAVGAFLNRCSSCRATRSAGRGFFVNGFSGQFQHNTARDNGGLDLEDAAGVFSDNVYANNDFPDNNLGL